MKRLIPVAFLIGLIACTGSPAGPSGNGANTFSPPARGLVGLPDVRVSGTKTATGYSYTVRITAQNGGTGAATISNAVLDFSAGGTIFTSVTVPDAFSSSSMAAGSTQTSRTITIADDVAGHPYAESLAATVTYDGGGAGTDKATRSTAVPGLPSGPTGPTSPSR
jgi:hypothetical protein